jgi:hypothetical protein
VAISGGAIALYLNWTDDAGTEHCNDNPDGSCLSV